MEGQNLISPDVVARYAGDAAREVEGVVGIVEGVRKGIRVDDDQIEIHLAVRYGLSLAAVAGKVQSRVAEYLEQMTDLRPASVNIVIDEVDGGD